MIIENNIDVLNEEIQKLSREKINNSTAQTIALYYMAKIALKNVLNENKEFAYGEKIKEYEPTNSNEFKASNIVLPNVQEYFANHTENNLKKACLELKEMCQSVYSTLMNNNEKNVFFETFENMTTF